MAEMLDASSSDEVKLWLQQVHVALEKQPARELFAKFNRDTTVCIACMLMILTSCRRRRHRVPVHRHCGAAQVHIVNQASAFVQRIFSWRTGDADSKVDQSQFHKAKCSIYLYYR